MLWVGSCGNVDDTAGVHCGIVVWFPETTGINRSQHIPDWYEDSLLKHYEDTYFPEHMEKAGKASYVERNQEMINKSNFCIVYYDENYAPPRRKNSKRDLFDYQPKSGTKVALDYAIKKGIYIKNIFLDI